MKKIMKTILKILLVVLIITMYLYLAIQLYKKYFPYKYDYYYNKIVNNVDIQEIHIDRKNNYFVNDNFLYAKNTDIFFPENKQDIIDITRTFFNSGDSKLIFYCNPIWEECTEEFYDYLENTEHIVNIINYFNHPFNDVNHLEFRTYKNSGKVILERTNVYSDELILETEEKIDEIFKELYNPNKSDRDNIRKFYYYLLENVDYDAVKASYIKKESESNSSYLSYTAYGALIENKAICSGYTDSMYLYLEKMGLKSMRIGNDTHVWNLVYLNGEWLHIDVTWGRGKYTDETEFLRDDYLLITTDKLKELNDGSHEFDLEIFQELTEE